MTLDLISIQKRFIGHAENNTKMRTEGFWDKRYHTLGIKNTKKPYLDTVFGYKRSKDTWKVLVWFFS